nr:putative reverse transcriptase domain-containing protein [Tanacetum cinerariifolium]
MSHTNLTISSTLELDKIYHNLKQFHQWLDMEAGITTYVSKCLTCLKRRDDYQNPSGLLVQPEIPHWKWENIAMDFITRLPKTTSSHDTIWEIVIIKKNYANMKRKPLEIQIRNKTMLKVSSWKGVIRFGKRGKLNARYIGHFKIIAKVRTVSKVGTVHVSKLKKCMAEEPLAIPLEEIQVDDKLNFIEEPVKIMDREVKRLK